MVGVGVWVKVDRVVGMGFWVSMLVCVNCVEDVRACACFGVSVCVCVHTYVYIYIRVFIQYECVRACIRLHAYLSG